jgi:hypothetical protein
VTREFERWEAAKGEDAALFRIVGFCRCDASARSRRQLPLRTSWPSWRIPRVCSAENKWTASGWFNPDTLQKTLGPGGELIGFKTSSPHEFVKARDFSLARASVRCTDMTLDGGSSGLRGSR